MQETIRQQVIRGLSVVLCLFTLAEVNYPHLQPQSQMAIFALLGLVLCFLHYPVAKRFQSQAWAKAIDWLFAAVTAVCCGYVVVQTEPVFQGWWFGGQSLGNRAGAEVGSDYLIASLGLIMVLEATRRVVGPALPTLALIFVAYAFWGQSMPDWLFPHRGYDFGRIVSQTFLHSQGVFGIALRIMLTYVFLFVVFGAVLEATGATRFIIDAAQRVFGGSAGAPAKVSVLSSGLMGSLSGSAVANTATTGTFTIPLMRSSGFKPHVAGGIEAAASSGGALVPPVMGAGAYMMLEIISPPVTYLEIIRAAMLPAILYYFSIFMMVHFTAKLQERETAAAKEDEGNADISSASAEKLGPKAGPISGLIFVVSLSALVGFLFYGLTVFRAVSLAMALAFGISLFSPAIRLTPRRLIACFERAARGGVSLVAASASVGIVLGVVTLTGIGSKLPATILPMAENNLFLALLLIMLSSIVLGMGLPSAVCYLLLATLIGPALSGLGVVPLAAHLFIFYFGLMSMVTPPVALAAYTAASIAGSRIMRTAVVAFRFSLIGFVLPFLFVYRPELLMLSSSGDPAPVFSITVAFVLMLLGVVPLAAGLAGYFIRPLSLAWRLPMIAAAILIFAPTAGWADLPLGWTEVAGLVLFGGLTAGLWKKR